MESFYTYFFKEAKGLRKAAMDARAEEDPHHMEHYHKHGFDPSKDRCILVDRDKGIDAVLLSRLPADVDSPQYYEEISKGKSFDEIKDWLEKNCGGNTKCIHVQSADDFEKYGLWDKIGPCFDYCGEYPSREGFEKSCRVIYEVTKDLKTKHPNIPLDIDWIIPFSFTKTKYGNSSKDKRHGMSFLGLIDNVESVKYLDQSFMHDDARRINDVCRHEIGHSLATQEAFDFSLEKLKERKRLVGREEFIREFLTSVSLYGVWYEAQLDTGECREGDKKYNKGIDEAIAEIFSVYTSPEYRRGTMPRQFEEIAEFLISPLEKSRGMEKDKIVQDSIEEAIPKQEECKHKPKDWERFCEMASISYGPGLTKYGYWNQFTDKWIPYEEGSRCATIQKLMREIRNDSKGNGDKNIQKQNLKKLMGFMGKKD